MTTTRAIVARAFRKIGVLAVDEQPTADMTVSGLDALNSMMHGWKLRGVDIAHSDLAMADDFPLAPEYEEGTVYLLAGRLSPDYTIPPAFDADDWFRSFQMHYTTVDAVDMPAGLLRMSSAYAGRKQRI